MTNQELRQLAEQARDDPHVFLVAGIHNVRGIAKLEALAKGILEKLDEERKA